MAGGSALRWGIMGTGNIARQFADGVLGARRSALAAVGSRSGEAARAFAQPRRIPNVHASYEALLADDAVDAVYVSLPNSLHHEWTVKALDAGKHVLCEKPLAVTEAQARQMFDLAQKQGLVLIEAFMYRVHPLTVAWLADVRAGRIGQVRLVRASFCFFTRNVDDNIRFRADLAGGALMDVGCYCLSLARLLAGCEPDEAHAVARMHETGVDELTAGTLLFPGGMAAQFVCGIRVHADNTLLVCGDAGYVQVPVPWKPPATGAQYTLASSIPPKADGPGAQPMQPRQTVELDTPVPLYALEADAFAASVLDGAEPFVSRQDTLGNVRLLERLRRQVGLAY